MIHGPVFPVGSGLEVGAALLLLHSHAHGLSP